MEGCLNTDIEVHHIRSLYRKIVRNLFVTSVKSGKKELYGMKVIILVLVCKQVPLCKQHYCISVQVDLMLRI